VNKPSQVASRRDAELQGAMSERVIEMLRIGIQPNAVTFNSVIDACAKVKDE